MEAVTTCFYFDRNNLIEGKDGHARERDSRPKEVLEWAKEKGLMLKQRS